jgi:hypothetical protein
LSAFRGDKLALCLDASAAVLTASAGVGALARWVVADWFGLVAAAGARMELSRPRIVIEQLGTVHELAPVSLTLSLGAEWIW